MMEAKLVLEDGTVIHGKGFGSETTKFGELIFCTSMTGYVESLTDPSYKGHILMMTYPLIGNYGVNPEWYQSDGIKAEGLVIRELCQQPSHYACESNLSKFLEDYGIPGICEVDTRALTIKIRKIGSLKGAISTEDISDKELLSMVREYPDITEIDLVDEVSTKKPKFFGEGNRTLVILDCGVKRNIIRSFVERKTQVILLPYHATPTEILEYDPDAVLVSNGPGDPRRVKNVIYTIKKLSNKLPIFGICLGHQLISLAFGAKIFKMKFGHRGSNHPVKDIESGEVYITSQNHGFAVDISSSDLPIEITQINLNDGTIEGIKHKELPILSVQYHPEAGPGPYDTRWLFDKFIKIMDEY